MPLSRRMSVRERAVCASPSCPRAGRRTRTNSTRPVTERTTGRSWQRGRPSDSPNSPITHHHHLDDRTCRRASCASPNRSPHAPVPAWAGLAASSRRQRTPCSAHRPRHASSSRVGPTCMPASSSDPPSLRGGAASQLTAYLRRGSAQAATWLTSPKPVHKGLSELRAALSLPQSRS